MNKEYIEREAAVAFLENMAASRYLIQCFEDKEKFPAADVAPVVHGEWIPIVSYYHGKPDGRYYCSECRRVVNKYERHCPACGALMDGDSKKEVDFYIDPKNYNISQRLADGGNK